MESFFEPGSIVVVGVSERPENLARNIVMNCLNYGYRGQIHAVGKSGGQVKGIPIIDMDSLPEGVELAVVLTPAPIVPEIVDALGRKGVRRVIVESGGFGELGSKDLERRLEEAIHGHGIRLIGPNCIGVMNPAAGVFLPFGPQLAVFRPGQYGLLSQSGGVAIAISGDLAAHHMGMGVVVSMGNKLDVCEADLLPALMRREDIKVGALYLEGVTEGRRLLDAIRSTTKPVVVFKSNVRQTGSTIAMSHTGALANDDLVVTAALRDAGAVRVKRLSDLVSAIKAFYLPPMPGDRLAIFSRSGGHAVIAQDHAEALGFSLPPLPEEVLGLLGSRSRAGVIRLGNPLDLGDVYDFDAYLEAMELVLADPGFDGLLFIHTYRPIKDVDQCRYMLPIMAEISTRHDKPLLICLITEDEERKGAMAESPLPVFDKPEEALAGLALSLEQRRGLERRMALPAAVTADDSRAEEILRRHPRAGLLPMQASLELLDCYGIPVPRWRLAPPSPEAAGQVAQELGSMVAVKLLSPVLSHKSDAGLVFLGRAAQESVAMECARMLEVVRGISPRPTVEGFLVQAMASKGVELIVGGHRDPTFGAVVTFGLGGVLTEVLAQVEMSLAPLAEGGAARLVDMVEPAARMLAGVRSMPPADREAVEGLLNALGALMADMPRITELDLNPVIATPDGALAVDVRIIVDGSRP